MNTTHKNISIPRFAFLAATLLGLLCLTPNGALAAKLESKVTPDSLEANGFSMKVENQKDGAVEFTIVRDLSKAKSFPAGSGLQISRYATLRVAGQSGLFVQCDVAPRVQGPPIL